MQFIFLNIYFYTTIQNIQKWLQALLYKQVFFNFDPYKNVNRMVAKIIMSIYEFTKQFQHFTIEKWFY